MKCVESDTIRYAHFVYGTEQNLPKTKQLRSVCSDYRIQSKIGTIMIMSLLMNGSSGGNSIVNIEYRHRNAHHIQQQLRKKNRCEEKILINLNTFKRVITIIIIRFAQAQDVLTKTQLLGYVSYLVPIHMNNIPASQKSRSYNSIPIIDG